MLARRGNGIYLFQVGSIWENELRVSLAGGDYGRLGHIDMSQNDGIGQIGQRISNGRI